jgi:hypothetical protein
VACCVLRAAGSRFGALEEELGMVWLWASHPGSLDVNVRAGGRKGSGPTVVWWREMVVDRNRWISPSSRTRTDPWSRQSRGPRFQWATDTAHPPLAE